FISMVPLPIADTRITGTSSPWAATYAAANELYLIWYRIYDPVHGRWLSRDPIGEAGGVNLYGYVGNGPIIGRDPYGLYSFLGFNPISQYLSNAFDLLNQIGVMLPLELRRTLRHVLNQVAGG